MGVSNKQFNRWFSIRKTTWPYQVFTKYNDELNRMLWSQDAVNRTIYRNLKDSSATWTNKASDFLTFSVPKDEEVFPDLKSWSSYFNKFDNWINLNSLVTLLSNLETYLATIISLSIESDPGLLLGSSKAVDGIMLLKNNIDRPAYQDDLIMSCTKGDWNSRISAFKKIFLSCPQTIEIQIGELEKMRTLRNKIAHAFGRDIQGSRNHEVKEIMEMEGLTKLRLKKYQYLIWNVVKDVDSYLLQNHIGEYQSLVFYHRLYNDMRKDLHPNQRAVYLKKAIGKLGDQSGKLFCNGLVDYYESL